MLLISDRMNKINEIQAVTDHSKSHADAGKWERQPQLDAHEKAARAQEHWGSRRGLKAGATTAGNSRGLGN